MNGPILMRALPYSMFGALIGAAYLARSAGTCGFMQTVVPRGAPCSPI